MIKLDGSVPTKYGLCLNADDKYSNLKQYLSSLCNIPPFLIKLADLYGSQIKVTWLSVKYVWMVLGLYFCIEIHKNEKAHNYTSRNSPNTLSAEKTCYKQTSLLVG